MTAKPATKPVSGAAHLAETGAVTLKPLFNRSELEMYRLLEACVTEVSPALRVFGQVALPEIAATASRFEKGSAYHAVKERRLDFVVTDPATTPLIAAEFHGPWHETKRVQRSDDIKRTILARVGVPLLVIDYKMTDEERKRTMIMALLRALGDRMAAAVS